MTYEFKKKMMMVFFDDTRHDRENRENLWDFDVKIFGMVLIFMTHVVFVLKHLCMVYEETFLRERSIICSRVSTHDHHHQNSDSHANRTISSIDRISLKMR